ncbi:50S ribosomal protein L2 [Buchnera aphidicola]|uniref:Large ribosomal subunit protein uL2 n=2 Tax=Buchnera aphidicola (Cinara cedri) TaxID=261318 RepID=RL2_BUCCC|nr:50S ribosomal protein L2 [Buchnera aphidicola]Q057A7.1 RecName: Full=Large ribosomal subunit protein uL2; AltName: Full=50S ribosomal protein L2 [Buchnera aphidicola BCc]AAW72704.1 50S ribosomal protein L2 [Buchnera aphidicola (Cinara cedri)]ABJ90792.1 50S ribosomal protein L2 [Buchnera aphidicola BCc]
MVIVRCKPTSPGRRHVVKVICPNLYKGRPIASLLQKKVKTGGRNNYGRITTRHIGGGHKKLYRCIDFKRRYDNVPAVVQRIEYDPNRSSNIILILYKNGKRSYILEPKGIKVGDIIESGNLVPIKLGNALPIKKIPIGTILHNIEIKSGKGGQIARSAGSYAQLISKENKYVVIRLRSGELRKIHIECRATIGEVGNSEHMLRILGKAGASRRYGIRPTVRGTAMNPVDHPHGGGEGRNFGKHPVSPWGLKTKGKKTRRNKRTERFIVRHRNK